MGVPRVVVAAFFRLSCASAQWLNHAAPGIPRTANGKPNLAAPQPQHLLPNTELLECVCNENEKDILHMVGK